MSEFTELNELDVVFISYDEDNCEENWADLVSKIPWAKRVHGVYGSDAAHKAAAMQSETERFISIDADNIVDPAFFDQKIDFSNPKFKDKVVSWSAKNSVNGLEYGNGGLKCWPVKYVMEMRTHEAAPEDDQNNQIDFCWEDSYVQMNNQYCTTYPNGSPRQAFRAGFREGVKMSLDRGKPVSNENFEKQIWWGNYNRLMIWCTVGKDVVNGDWAMYGARLGAYMTNMTEWDINQVRDFEYLNRLFWEEVSDQFKGDETTKCHSSGYHYQKDLLWAEIAELGTKLRKEIGLQVAEFDELDSKFFKRAYINLPRMGSYVTEDEMNALRELNA